MIHLRRKCLLHRVEIKRRATLVDVAVALDFKTTSFEDVVVGTPRRRREVDATLRSLVKARKEVGADAQRASPGERLHRRDALLRKRGAALAKHKLRAELPELSKALHWEVFLVERCVSRDALLGLADDVEHQRLARVSAVRALREVHLARCRILFECGDQSKDGIRRSLRNAGPS